MGISETLETTNLISGAIEAPRYSCALGGAYATAVGIFGTVPILHSGAGCGIGQLFGQFAGGQSRGPFGEFLPVHLWLRACYFRWEKKLENLIKSQLNL